MTKEDLTAKAKKVKEEGKIFRCGSNAAENAAKNARLAELARVLGRRNSGNTK